MKIVMATDIYYPLVCGCTYFIERLAKQLQERGHEVIVICPSESFSNTKTIINGIEVYGIRSLPIFRYDKVRMSILIPYNKYIDQIVENFKPDVIHCQFHFGIVRATLRVANKRGIPTVGTNHFMPENMVHYLPLHQILGKWYIKWAWMDFGRVFRKMDKITTPTQTAANLIMPYVKKEVIPISCGIDLTLFKPGQECEYLREKYNIPRKPILLTVGRLDKEKNLDLIIKASAEAMKEVDFQLVIAGKGSEERKLRQLVLKLGISDSVKFTGFVSQEDLPKLYCLADCFIIAGSAELQSIATMEAMASGLPILAVNAVALPELIQNNKNGYFFFTDLTGISNSIKKALNTREHTNKMGKKSLELIKIHSFNYIIKQFIELYIKSA